MAILDGFQLLPGSMFDCKRERENYKYFVRLMITLIIDMFESNTNLNTSFERPSQELLNAYLSFEIGQSKQKLQDLKVSHQMPYFHKRL